MKPFDNFFPPQVQTLFSEKSVNCALPENPPFVSEAQKACFSAEGFSWKKIVNIRQVHGNRVIVVTKENVSALGTQMPVEADGAVTDLPGVVLAVRTADCLPVFLFDEKKKCVGLVHAGWRGTQKNIVAEALKALKERSGSEPEGIRAALGPSIGPCCYRVGEEFKKIFPGETRETPGGLLLDLAAVNKGQLLRQGVKEENIFLSPACTCCDGRFFSYRRQKEAAGRHISLMMLRSF
jgi:YfiH family protein